MNAKRESGRERKEFAWEERRGVGKEGRKEDDLCASLKALQTENVLVSDIYFLVKTNYKLAGKGEGCSKPLAGQVHVLI